MQITYHMQEEAIKETSSIFSKISRSKKNIPEKNNEKEILTKIFLKDAIIPNSILFHLLEKITVKYDNYYLFNYTSFRRLLYNNLLDDFVISIAPFYQEKSVKYISKQPMTYNSFVTIIRQLCTWNQIPFTIKRQYNHSLSNNDYYIYYRTTNSS